MAQDVTTHLPFCLLNLTINHCLQFFAAWVVPVNMKYLLIKYYTNQDQLIAPGITVY